jgi:lysozyme
MFEKIASEEGFSKFLYKCSGDKYTIGYGFNLEDSGIPEPVARHWLQYNINHLQARLAGFDFYDGLDEARKAVLVDMAYQMGVDGLLRFKNMIKDIKVGAWDCAAKSLLDSKYAREDSPNRAKRNAETMRTGKLLLNN